MHVCSYHFSHYHTMICSDLYKHVVSVYIMYFSPFQSTEKTKVRLTMFEKYISRFILFKFDIIILVVLIAHAIDFIWHFYICFISSCFNQQGDEDILGNITDYHNRQKLLNLRDDFSESETRDSSFDMKTCSYKTKLYVKSNTLSFKEPKTKKLLLAKECLSHRFFFSDKGEFDVVFKIPKVEEYIDFAATKLRYDW